MALFLGACRMPRCKECARALWPHACPLLLPRLNSQLTAAAHIGIRFASKMLRKALLLDSARRLPPAKALQLHLQVANVARHMQGPAQPMAADLGKAPRRKGLVPDLRVLLAEGVLAMWAAAATAQKVAVEERAGKHLSKWHAARAPVKLGVAVDGQDVGSVPGSDELLDAPQQATERVSGVLKWFMGEQTIWNGFWNAKRGEVMS